jgi:hypothetical protein
VQAVEQAVVDDVAGLGLHDAEPTSDYRLLSPP